MSYSKNMCLYVVEKEQDGLIRICEDFSDNVKNPYDNVFFLQNGVLDVILKNLKTYKKNAVNLSSVFKGLKENELMIIESLKLVDKFNYQQELCSKIGVEYYNHDSFLEVLEDNLTEIANKYNLNAGDDYNKLYNYIFALKLTLASSDDPLKSLTNRYEFLTEHSPKGKVADEYITVHGNKIHKIDILKQLLDEYTKKLVVNPIEEMTTIR